MGEYNFREHLSMEEILKNKEYYAKLFSEGNLVLNNLLLYCWNNNIDTYMCCEGHKNAGYDYSDDPFVIFEISCEGKELIYKIINSVKNIPYLSYTLCQSYNGEKIYLDVRIPYYSEEINNKLFENMYYAITSKDYDYNTDIELRKIVTILTAVNSNSYKLTIKGGYEERKNNDDYLLWFTPIEMCESPLHRACKSSPITLKHEDLLDNDTIYYHNKIKRLEDKSSVHQY